MIGRQLPLSAHRIITLIDISEHKLTQARLQEQYDEISKLTDTVVAQALDLKSYSQELEERVRQRTADLREANLQAVFMLAVASEAKDADTGAHVRRIQLYSQTIARELGLSDTDSEHIGVSSILHDVGKIHVPDRILKKPGPLSESERTEMRLHTIASERIISDKPFFDVARVIARNHHEDFNGGGYPDGLSRRNIPYPARIVHLVDVYDALTSRRVYKPAWTPQLALTCILDNRGKQFDPDIVDAFVSLYRRRALLNTPDRQPPPARAPDDPHSEPRP